MIGFVFSQTSHAASVYKVKGRKVLVKTEGTNMKVGDLFYIVSETGKKKGLLKVRKIKGNKAIGVISKKSKARSGWGLKKKKTKRISKRRKRKRNDDEYDPRSSLKKASVGGMLGLNMANMSVSDIGDKNTNNLNDSKLSGTGFSAKGLVDYKLFDSIWFRGLIGMESLAMEDDPSNLVCGTQDTTFTLPCIVEITYVTVDLHARYVFGIGKFRPWVGGGISLLFPMSKKSSALSEDSIEIANTFIASTGLDYHFSPKWVVPVQVEFNLFPSSDTVSASFIAARLGLAYKF